MGRPRDYHSKWRRSERERQISHDITYMWNLKYDTKNSSMKQKQTHKENRLGTDKGEEEVGEINWEFGISRCKLINKILLYNTGNYSQYPVINYMEKNMKRMCVYIYSRVRLCSPIDGSPPGSPVPGILQARTLEWVVISFTNAWKWKVKVKLLSRIQLLANPWTAAHQAPPSMGFSRQDYWSGVPLPSPKLVTSHLHISTR